MTIITLYLVFSMLAVLWFDITRYLIPNWLVASLLALYPVAVWLSPHAVDWKMALVAMMVVFAVGYAVFAMKWMGGGDIKLITVCALWVGFKNLLDFVFMFALIGGIFSAAVWGLRKILPFIPKLAGKQLPRILRDKEPVPYGIAIVLGFLVMFYTNKIPAISLH